MAAFSSSAVRTSVTSDVSIVEASFRFLACANASGSVPGRPHTPHDASRDAREDATATKETERPRVPGHEQADRLQYDVIEQVGTASLKTKRYAAGSSLNGSPRKHNLGPPER